MVKINIKTNEEIDTMKVGGKKLHEIKNSLRKAVKKGSTAGDVEDLAEELIQKSGGESSFKKVPGYKWNTCVNVNDGVVHGIPHKHIKFKPGDIVSVDVGLFYNGFHTDTSFSVEVDTNKESKFLDAGREALSSGIKQAKAGNRVYDISKAIEDVFKKHDLTPIRSLVGHGVGRDLHEAPQIPCFTLEGKREMSPELPKGAVLAIEVMYTKGDGKVYIEDSDGWTIRTNDGKMSALFEETVALENNGSFIIT